MTQRNPKQCKRWVIKIGSALVTDDGRGLNHSAIQSWAEQFATLCSQGYELILVTSGAVAEGMARLKLKTRPHTLHELQAAAAVGQMGLIRAYEQKLLEHSIHCAQVLLTHEDLRDRKRYLNARSTLNTLLDWKTLPVVNENDTVATDEIQFGDNDTLAALVANLVEADLLVILTDQAGLYDSNPRENPEAQLIERCDVSDHALDTAAGPSHHSLGRGGMLTKISAARRAARSGAMTIIAGGANEDILCKIASDTFVGTRIYPSEEPLAARKQWIANQLQVSGELTLDAGATKVLLQDGASLLAIGVTEVSGQFERGELVVCKDASGNEIGRGLSNYSAEETHKILGKASHQIEEILGYVDEPELIHRDNLIIA